MLRNQERRHHHFRLAHLDCQYRLDRLADPLLLSRHRHSPAALAHQFRLQFPHSLAPLADPAVLDFPAHPYFRRHPHSLADPADLGFLDLQ